MTNPFLVSVLKGTRDDTKEATLEDRLRLALIYYFFSDGSGTPEAVTEFEQRADAAHSSLAVLSYLKNVNVMLHARRKDESGPFSFSPLMG